MKMFADTLIRQTTFLAIVATLAACSAGKDNEAAPLVNAVRDGDRTVELRPTWTGQATSFSQRGDDEYRVGYFVQDGTVLAEYSLLAEEDVAVDSLDLDIAANGLGFSAVIAHGAGTNLDVTGSISSTDDGEGYMVSDFSGLGAMIVASDGAHVTLDSMDIRTEGFARSAFISDEHANMVVRGSNVTTMGANPLTEAYEGYVNSANVTKMISPPWVLGIQGGIRASNMLGERATLTLIGTTLNSGGWALLSTDGCTEPQMNVVDSTLRILPQSEGGMSSGSFSYSDNYGSGYGTYAIGRAKQNFYGTSVSGTTYATIFTGGEVTYASSNGDIALRDGDGEVFETVQGKGRPTVIDSVFGFMSHGDATANIVDGTKVNSQDATFLYKSGNVTINIDSAELNPANGVILQMIDNDDRIVGGSMQAFNTEFNEDAGWPSENGNVTPGGVAAAAMPGGPGGPGGEGGPGGPGGPEGPGGPGGEAPAAGDVVGPDGQPITVPRPDGPGMRVTRPSAVSVSLTNGQYAGDLYNGTGYYGQGAVPLQVTIGEGAQLTGSVSLTETRHINETGAQNTHFTINEYYYLGHVENRNYDNGFSKVAVTVDNGGTWIVDGENLLNSLTIGDGQVTGVDDQQVSMTVDGEPVDIGPGQYAGNIIISLAD